MNENERTPKWGLVLGGGGIKGAYEVGVWKALRELNIPLAGVAGTSIGALNAALIVQNDFGKIEDMYRHIRLTDVIPVSDEVDPNKDIFDMRNIRGLVKEFFKQEGLDNAPLRRTLETALDPQKVYDSQVDLGIVTYEVSALSAKYFFKKDIPQEHLIDYLLASANFPIFKMQQIGGRKFLDGGIHDNIPVSMMAERGFTHLIVVDIEGIGGVQKVGKGEDLYIKLIRCSENLGGLFNFDPQRIEKNMSLGYLDTMKAFHHLFGNYYCFDRASFNRLLESFDLKTIFGLETAARIYGIDLHKVYRADEFLEALSEKHKETEALYETIFPEEGAPNLTRLRNIADKRVLIVGYERILREQPTYRVNNALGAVLDDVIVAGSAMIELKNDRKR